MPKLRKSELLHANACLAANPLWGRAALVAEVLQAASLATPSYAASTWIRSAGNPGNWTDAANWSGGVPSSYGDAYINNGGTATLSTTANLYSLYLGYNTSTESGTLTIADGQLTTSIAFIGYNGTGRIINSGGIHNITSGYPAFVLGYNSGSNGTYELTNNGTLSFAIN